MKIKRHSWILSVACYGGLRFERGEKTNVCSLFWRFVWGMLRAPVIGTTIAVPCCLIIVAFIGFPLFELWAHFWLGLEWGREDKITLGIIAVLWVVGLYGALSTTFNKHPIESTIGSARDLMRSRWRDYKAKTCTIVEIE